MRWTSSGLIPRRRGPNTLPGTIRVAAEAKLLCASVRMRHSATRALAAKSIKRTRKLTPSLIVAPTCEHDLTFVPPKVSNRL
jgi:hypothetical protein